MTLYRNGYLVFTINGHDLTMTFYWSLLIITKENSLQGKKNILTKHEIWMTKRKKKITRKGMTIYCKP
jgi:hypothetical protein